MSEPVEWETAKENFVPVKQGRPTSALVTPVSGRKKDKELEDAKRAFLADIEATDDPLPVWLKYIKWTQEQYSTQASRTELQQVLEAATRALSNQDCYKDDIRLLRIWIQYADCLTDPSSVFLYLQDHSIGRDHALLYEAYAAYLELKGSFSQAGLVYQEGINRLAKPLERLKQKHSAFQQRMAKRQERQMAEASLGMAPAAADAGLARSTLAPLVPLDATPQLDENGNPIQPARAQQRGLLPQRAHPAASVALGVRPAPVAGSNTSSRTSSSRRPAAHGPPAASLWVPGSSSSSSTTSQQQRSNNLLLNSLGLPGGSTGGGNAAPRQLEVHVDEEFGPSGQGPIPTAFPPALGQHAQLPGFAAATKENSSKPAVWAGTKLKQQPVFAAPVSNKIEVFEDEDSEEEEAGAAAAAHAPPRPQQGLRQRLDAALASPPPAAAAAAAAAATVHQGSSVPSQAAAGVPSSAAGHDMQQQQQQAPSAGQQQQQQPTQRSSKLAAGTAAAAAAPGPPQGYDEALLKCADGQEQSFEEVRAAMWRKRKAVQQQQQQQEQSRCQQHQQQQQQQHPEVPAVPMACSDRQDHQQQPHPQRQQQQEQQQEQQQLLENSAAAPPKAACKKPRAPLLPCPDATCQGAVAASRGQENQGAAALPEGQAKSSQPEHAGSSNGGTKSTRPPLGTSHPAAAAPVGTTASSAAAAASVDAGNVTFNTRAAFNAMNGMFGGGDDTTTMHGFGRAAAAAAHTRHTAAVDAGGVTLNTRAAFDAMNGMFGSGDDTTTMHGFGRAAARGHHTTAVDAGGVTLNTRAAFDAMNGMFGSGDDTTTMHGFGRAGSGAEGMGMEPTVTVNTRAAFEYMNGVFGGAADVTLGHTAAMGGPRRGGRKTSRLSMAAAAAAGARSSSIGPGALLGVYEDTELISHPGGAHALAASDSSQQQLLGVYEDTEFVGAAAAAAAVGAGNSGHASMPAPAPAGSNGGLGLCEDTEFITRPVDGSNRNNSSMCSMAAAVGPSHASGLGLYEDTEFITGPVGTSAGPESGSGLGLYEDTEFITRPVAGPAADAAAAGGGGGARHSGSGSGNTLLLSKLDRLSLANEALSRGQANQWHGLRGSQECEGTGGGAGAMSLGLYEDTEFISDAAAGAGSSGALELYTDTEFLTKPVSIAAAAAKAAEERQRGDNRAVASCSNDECSSTAQLRRKENVPVAAAGSSVASSQGLGLTSLGSSGSGSILQQQHHSQHAYGAAGPSRFGPGSVPNSPGGSRPGTAANTPGRPPRTPGTPSAGLGCMVQHMDSFEVMDSPAVHAALAGRPQQPGTAGSSPAGSLASPGYGARENIPVPAADGQKDRQQPLQPRSLADRAVRAAALQPISASRAELLGVQLDENAEAGCVEEEAEQQKAMVRQSPGRALRSLRFGREHGSGGGLAPTPS